MGVKISELNEATSAQNSDVLPIVQNGETKKIQKQNLLKELTTELTNVTNEIENMKDDITTVKTVGYSYNNNVAVEPPVVFYKNGLIYVYAQLITGVTGIGLSLLQFSKYKAISSIGDFTSPINCHGGCDGETGIRAGSDVVFVNISTSNGNGKVFIVIPVEEK